MDIDRLLIQYIFDDDLNIIASTNMSDLKAELIEQCMSVGALRFGTFTLKSGR